MYFTGNVLVAGVATAAAFYILVPISYLLLLSAGLLIISRFYKYIFHLVCMFSFLCIFILASNNFVSANLGLLTIGLLGVICGYVPIEQINNLVRYRYTLISAYLCYVIAITIWNQSYILQIVGVCLSLMVLYLAGATNGKIGRMRGLVILLGKYSLFGYIAQIAILQLLRRGLRHIDVGSGALGLSFFAALALTIISVKVVDRLRARAATVDRLYKAVFS